MRKSRQKGWICSRGKKWYGCFRKWVVDSTTYEQKRIKVTFPLGLKSEITRSEAQEILEYQIIKQTGQHPEEQVLISGTVSFGWFVRRRFFPLKEAIWRPETSKVKKALIESDLIRAFEEIALQDIDRFRLQIHLNLLAKSVSRDRVLQMRSYVRDIFAEAADQGFIDKDPTRKLPVPTQLRATDRTTLSWEQLRRILNSLCLCDRILLELGMTNALRPSELFALRWRCFDEQEHTLCVNETVYKGNIRPWGKTRRSLGIIHVPEKLAADLLTLKELRRDVSPESFIFPNDHGGFIDADQFRKRVLHQLVKDLELPKLTFQVIRRTIATLAQKKGTVKDVQAVLRHSRAATTTDIYMQEIPESVRATVTSINDELRMKSAGSLASPSVQTLVKLKRSS